MATKREAQATAAGRASKPADGPLKGALRDGNGGDKGSVDLPGDLFGARIHRHAMWLAVRSYLINQRQGTSKVKGRKEVSGGGIKPWRQKGTGRARSGTIRSPLWVGGARAFGVFDDLRFAAFHDGDAAVGGAEVDADDLAHVGVLKEIRG